MLLTFSAEILKDFFFSIALASKAADKDDASYEKVIAIFKNL